MVSINYKSVYPNIQCVGYSYFANVFVSNETQFRNIVLNWKWMKIKHFVIIIFLKTFYTECSIAGAHEKIAECKKQILQAKRIRKNRQGKGFGRFVCKYFTIAYCFHAVFNVIR